MKAGLASGIFAIQTLQDIGFKPNGDIMVQSVSYKNEGYQIFSSPFLVKTCGKFNRFLPTHKSITGAIC
jgi:hypothetical protein